MSKRRPYSGARGERGVKRRHVHLYLTDEECARLTKLSHKWKMTAVGVVRTLLIENA